MAMQRIVSDPQENIKVKDFKNKESFIESKRLKLRTRNVKITRKSTMWRERKRCHRLPRHRRPRYCWNHCSSTCLCWIDPRCQTINNRIKSTFRHDQILLWLHCLVPPHRQQTKIREGPLWCTTCSSTKFWYEAQN